MPPTADLEPDPELAEALSDLRWRQKFKGIDEEVRFYGRPLKQRNAPPPPPLRGWIPEIEEGCSELRGGAPLCSPRSPASHGYPSK